MFTHLLRSEVKATASLLEESITTQLPAYTVVLLPFKAFQEWMNRWKILGAGDMSDYLASVIIAQADYFD